MQSVLRRKFKVLCVPRGGMISLVAQLVKHPLTMWETRVRSVVWEDPLEKEMATHSVFLPGKSHGWKEPGRLQSLGSQSRTRLSKFTHSLRGGMLNIQNISVGRAGMSWHGWPHVMPDQGLSFLHAGVSALCPNTALMEVFLPDRVYKREGNCPQLSYHGVA